MNVVTSPQAVNESAAAVQSPDSVSVGEALHCIPLVLGITGHRDLRPEDEGPLMEAVGRVFDELQQQYRHTLLVLLSPLNEGADRLAAKVAKKKGVQLIAVLAWPEGVCNDQLHRTGSEAEFNELLSGAAHVVHLSLIEGTSEADIQNSKDARAAHYAQVGAYIARHSQYLIALWDGENTPRGGTARVVRWQREGKTAPFAPNVGLLDEVESGPVCHILTPRSGRNPPDGAMTRKILYPEGTAARPDERQAEREFRRVWQNLDRFNRDAARLQTHSAGAVRASRGYVLSNADVARLSTPLQSLLQYYAVADAVALRCQAATFRTLLALILIAFVAVANLETYAHLWASRWLLLAYLSFMGTAAVWYAFARRRNFQNRYLDSRALAEALRVQFFWRLGLVDDSVADHYLRHFRSDLDWIRQAARACLVNAGAHCPLPLNLSTQEQAERLRQILRHWIEDQHDYFSRKAYWHEQWHRRLARTASAFLVVALALAAVQLTIPHHNHLLLTCMFLTLVAAALLHDYAEQRAFSVLARQYRWMESLFGIARQRLPELLDQNDCCNARKLIRELGQEALNENADWVIQHRHRPLEVPLG